MLRVLIVSTTTGYQLRSFTEAAEELGVELVYATDRCHVLDDPWRDRAVPVRFHAEETSVRAIMQAARDRPIDGVLAVGDRATTVAAMVARELGVPGHPPEAARVASNKRLARARMAGAGLPAPWSTCVDLGSDPARLAGSLSYPCVIKPLALSGSRGVMRVDTPAAFSPAFERLRRILLQKDIRVLRDPANDRIMVEGFVEGREFALEGVLERGDLRLLAIFDKPDPLDGPFFEETIYVTPSALAAPDQELLVEAVAQAARAFGLHHGPIHAECRLHADGVFVLEVAARPIGGLCSRALRFVAPEATELSLEALLLRHAVGEPLAGYEREAAAAGVLMIPISRAGILKTVNGLEGARAVPGIEEIRITAKPDQVLLPLPEGGSYLGFVFARAARREEVEAALRAAHTELRVVLEPALTMV
jgi:biotin carboxylase